MRRVLLSLFLLCALNAATASVAASQRSSADWKVQAGKKFQRAGEYVVRSGDRNTYVEKAIEAYGPGRCRVAGFDNHSVFTWLARGITIDAWTYGGMPAGENGCISPDLIHVNTVKLTDRRWTTALGLHVGDPTTKLRRLYPRSPYVDAKRAWGRNHYYLVWTHGPCVIGVCSAYEQRYGIDKPQLMAQVKQGRVVAFWLPVGGQGE
jgi:hypothetical protein